MNYFSGEIWELVKKVYREPSLAITVLDHSVDAIERDNGWVCNYLFDLISSETKYIAFMAGTDKFLHIRNRNINVVDLSSSIINVSTETLANAIVNTLGTEISDNIINANLNISGGIDLKMYDETTTITSEGNEVPFTGTIAGDKKQAATTFINDEYILKQDDVIVLKFVNNGTGDVRIEYNSNGYQE